MDVLVSIFDSIKPLLEEYSPPLQPKRNEAGYFDLWSQKDLLIEGRKRNEVFFAGIIIQKSYVGFYFMPVYVDEEIQELFPEAMLKLKRGKSCFHIRKLTPDLIMNIREVLKSGFLLYEKRGWI